jgi:quercetin dioxygenase-like cupin family protein
MTLVKFDKDAENVVSGSYSTGTGPVLRSDNMEITKITFQKGKGADTHQHAEEQVMYVLEGELEVTCDGETYRVKPGEATFNPSNAPHSVMAIETVVALSFKNQVAPIYEGTGRLDSSSA